MIRTIEHQHFVDPETTYTGSGVVRAAIRNLQKKFRKIKTGLVDRSESGYPPACRDVGWDRIYVSFRSYPLVIRGSQTVDRSGEDRQRSVRSGVAEWEQTEVALWEARAGSIVETPENIWRSFPRETRAASPSSPASLEEIIVARIDSKYRPRSLAGARFFKEADG